MYIMFNNLFFLDLEIEDLVNSTPYLGVSSRTPGQLLSLTSHLSFVSKTCTRNNCIHFPVTIKQVKHITTL